MKKRVNRSGIWLAGLGLTLLVGCAPQRVDEMSDGGDGEDGPIAKWWPDMDRCKQSCAADQRTVIDCRGHIVQSCLETEHCDDQVHTCKNACEVVVAKKQSVGCDYYATFMAQNLTRACFAAFVANTWDRPAHIQVTYEGKTLPIGSFAFLPSGAGRTITYAPYDPKAGLNPGGVVILFLAGPLGGPGSRLANCPVRSAFPTLLHSNDTGIDSSFHIQSDVPVVAYQMNPYGGGSAATTGASLLLPTSVWDTNYVAVNAYESNGDSNATNPSLNIVAAEDNTRVNMSVVAAVRRGGGIPSAPAGGTLTFILNAGQNAQITQDATLTGSVIQSDKPIGFMAGQGCSQVPVGTSACDHSEQMLPPVKALGSEYVGVMYRPRLNEPAIWRVIGVVNGTQLTWSTNVGGPVVLNLGEVKEFITGEPFVVKSQDADHPFILITYMSGSTWKPGMEGIGDPDMVLSVPPQQYMTDYVFFADPSYAETSLVIVRAKDHQAFHDVSLDCAGVLGNWHPIGNYEWTRVDLSTGNFLPVGGCSTGRHAIKSQGRFGLWVWGWGTSDTIPSTEYVSYGYPAGMNVTPINPVVIPPG